MIQKFTFGWHNKAKIETQVLKESASNGFALDVKLKNYCKNWCQEIYHIFSQEFYGFKSDVQVFYLEFIFVNGVR